MEEFSKNLKIQRQNKNLSQDELGKLIGVSGVTIMRYEKGLREPKLDTIKKIANALKIPVANLIDLNSPIMKKATDRFVSGRHTEEIETYGEVMDDIVMNSPLGAKINDYQIALAEVNKMQFELIALCYEALDEDGKKMLYNYARQLLENTDEFKQALKEHSAELPEDQLFTEE